MPVRSKRDLLAVRQRTRQLVSLLGFAATEQASIPSAVFDLAWQALCQHGQTRVSIAVEEGKLVIIHDAGVTPSPPVRLERALPQRTDAPAADDLLWLVQQLGQRTPLIVFEELARMNQDLLHVLVELNRCQGELAQLLRERHQPSAA
jgi:hypothetical protein